MKLLQRTKKPEKQCRKHFFDGKRKDESADRRNSRTDGGGAGEKGKYLLMAGIAVFGIDCCLYLPLGGPVLFGSMVGKRTDAWKGEQKSWRVH